MSDLHPSDRELPILAESAWFENGQVVIVDETALPDELKLIHASDCAAVASAIRDMKTRGFGQVLCVLYAMQLVAMTHGDDDRARQSRALADAAALLETTRATFPLKPLTRQALEIAAQVEGTSRDVARVLTERIDSFVKNTQRARQQRAESLSNHIGTRATLLTHCNMSGELVLIARACRAAGKVVDYIATETRPYFQGARLTTWELQREGFGVRLIADGAVANVMAKGMVDAVVVASDHSAANGDIANKVGTYQIAILAHHFKIPLYAFTQPSAMFPTGKDIPIEERPERELLTYREIPITAPGIKGYYPAFDITPVELITERFPVQIPRNVLGVSGHG